MSTPQEDLSVVGKIPKDKLLKLADMFDESVMTKAPKLEEIRRVIGGSKSDAKKVLTAFYNFVISKSDQSYIFDLINQLQNLTENEKIILKDIIEQIHNKVDHDKIVIQTGSELLKMFGHKHIRHVEMITEFRPISNQNRILKIIPAIVIDTPIFDRKGAEQRVNFQMDLETAEEFVTQLSGRIDDLKRETQYMRDKLGSDIV